ncbi:carboxy terminal-processing peptidase [Marinobacterium jannaschii]|uniref:carboxy terminal-processing peptidase n=1 Tax=Marinobacterium jannaschii TaxID=64970 RepID=UPI000488CC6A|nr:carboxy terminal-processing peptidase [Marinobacterium jannaschii]
MYKSLLHLIGTTTLAICLASPVAAKIPEPLKAEAIHSQTLLEIVDSLKLGHYKKLEINDTLSSQLLDKFLENLDPSKLNFYASDIREFEKYRFQLDEEIKAGKLDVAYIIFNRLQQRSNERNAYAIKLLTSSNRRFDFDVDENLDTDRTDDQWVSTREEMDNLWRKRVKSALLNLTLAEKSLEEAKETLIKRYANQQKRSDQINNDDVFQTYANTFTGQFDPHTQYFSPRRSENFKINMSLSLEGIGAVLQAENEYTKIVRLVPAGPADKTGQLKPADLILGVGQGEDGSIEDVVGWRLDDVVSKIRGPKDTVVRLLVRSSDSDSSQTRIVKIKRNKVKLEEQAAKKRILDIDYQGRQFKVGVIEIPAFYIDFGALQRGEKDYKSTTRDVEKLIAELQAEKIHGLIIDLRNNGGGSLREANELVGLFISRGPTVQIQDPNGRINVMSDRNPKFVYTGPVAVVVNRMSASASEIFAGAIQDYQRGIVLGGQTFGKGTVQTLLPLEHGQLKLTHAKFYRISGESTQHKGIIPDISFPTLYNTSEIGESALDGALEWDTIHPVRHGHFVGVSPFIEKLTKRHKQRVKDNPDFMFMQEQVNHLEEQRNDTLISLRKDKLETERSQVESWQLEAENRRRERKNLAPISKLSELDNELEKDSSGRQISPESEAILAESGRILLDMIDLTLKYTSAKN